MLRLRLLLACWALAPLALAQSNPHALPPPVTLTRAFTQGQFDTRRLERHIDYLASDALEGRFTGSAGIAKAADYLSKQLRGLGYKPLPTLTELRHRFTYVREVTVLWDSTSLILMPGGGAEPVQLRDGGFLPLGFSGSGAVRGEVVFAGYGISVPGGYDSYAGLDVRDKVVLLLRHLPTGLSATQRQELGRYADARYKAAVAKQKGARAVLFIADEWLMPGEGRVPS